MANAIYQLWKAQILQGTASALLNGTGATGVYCSLLNTTSYVFSQAHEFYSSWIGSPDAVIGTDQEITSKSYTNGIFAGSNLTYTSVTGTAVGALGLYVKNAGANTTWRVVLYEDTGVTGLPVTPNGGNITVTWALTASPDTSGIFLISDADRKHAIREIGYLGPARVVEFSYRGRGDRHVGLLAQEVEQYAAHAVREIDGCKRVDYGAAFRAALKLAA